MKPLCFCTAFWYIPWHTSQTRYMRLCEPSATTYCIVVRQRGLRFREWGAQKILPHRLQWCLLRNAENSRSQPGYWQRVISA
mmetsp:Transcript_5460/g.8558  ORF Transcript_5460/g.8558 Transcript_5460/m.8558 type:complete len:82 (+) Transcript_5460:168-413(+)